MEDILEKRPTVWLWFLLIFGTITSICFWLFPITIILIMVLYKRMEFNRKIINEINKKIIPEKEKMKTFAYNLALSYLNENNDILKQYLISKKIDDKEMIDIKNNLTLWDYLQFIIKIENKIYWFIIYDEEKGFKYFGYEKDQKKKYLTDYENINSREQEIVVLKHAYFYDNVEWNSIEYSGLDKESFNKGIQKFIKYKIEKGSISNYRFKYY